MSRIAKVYTLRATSAIEIHQKLSTINTVVTNPLPRMNNLVLNGNRITGNLIIPYTDVVGFTNSKSYTFVLDVESGLTYIIGDTDGRDEAVHILNSTIDASANTIELKELTNQNIITDIFQILQAQHGRNFIKKMKLTFGATGLLFGGSTTPFYELEYRFVGNTCASTHPNYQSFVQNAIRIKANFGIFRLGPISHPTKPTTITINDDFSVRLWTDFPPQSWIAVLDILTNF